MKFYIKTYGCQMNERDSDSAAAILAGAGYCQVPSEEDADIVILNDKFQVLKTLVDGEVRYEA